jgi:hypothetical protein
MDLELSLREERPSAPAKNANETKIENWHQSNCMCLMMIKRSIPEMISGSIVECESGKKFLKIVLTKFFVKNNKALINNTLSKLISMSYKGKRNIRST